MDYAHTPNANRVWHNLSDHLQAVAWLAQRSARLFGCGNAAFMAGLLHDLAKSNPDFQSYLKACAKGEKASSVPHSMGGAAYAFRLLAKHLPGDAWADVALPILGHHGGLPALSRAATHLYDWHDPELWQCLTVHANSLPHSRVPEPRPKSENQCELRLRMIFSALVDADFLDTERHFDSGKATARGEWTRLQDLWHVFRPDQLRMMWNGRGPIAVNQIRRQIYRACVRSASLPPGAFRLTVPTGGGKTRSGLAFALRHVMEHPKHGFRRFIIALPYTSIIDQTAREYRRIFGDRLVLEHQSQLDVPEDEQQDEQRLRHRLASENWDHPLIVTTTVQLFESLFHNRPSRCRKLHNIAKSILILDEVQTLPPELLEPTLDLLRDLVDNYGVTLVLSTATQPAFDRTPYLKHFNPEDIRQIVPDPEQFFSHEAMKRVEYQPVRWEQNLDDLADELCRPEAAQAMVVFNTRKAAVEMLDRLLQRKADGVYHLSTQLCGIHRKQLLKEIIRRLDRDAPKPVRLVSTQVVEAGVDLDFPLVYRAFGPLDRIVQVAGRCNREGKRPHKGKVIVFDFDGNRSPPGSYRIATDASEVLLKRNDAERLHKPEMHTEYFQCLFRDVDLDEKGIQPYRRDLNYPEVASRYKLIEDTVLVVIADYNDREGERRLQAHLHVPSRETYRRLIPYTVNLRRDELSRGEVAQCVEEVREGLYRWTGAYDDKTHRGLCGVVRDPADLIA